MGKACWSDKGKFYGPFSGEDAWDLIEEQPDAVIPRPDTSQPFSFSYDACPVGEDGRRRAVTRDGREVVLLCDDGPGQHVIIGWVMPKSYVLLLRWDMYGSYCAGNAALDLLIPPPAKRVVWVNLVPNESLGRVIAAAFDTEAEANADLSGCDCDRLGNRAYPIEIDEATP